MSCVRRLATAAALAVSLSIGGDGRSDDAFDHLQTGFPLTGAHARVRCEECHAGGVFEGTSTQCEACHLGAASVGVSQKPPDHVPSGQRCGDFAGQSHANAAVTERFNHSENIRRTGTGKSGDRVEQLLGQF